ncbi:DEAD/DEAH box helicase [Marinobacterium jannaschii]|uniref:DEAD/DEAH box helicase n=1 Tax=Marinobacterium jannaschii TaxID=64970 RepID=UPI0004890E77|nr:DEAD/DEAH box helicase [Marinobacterium jannaschii]
MKGIFKELLGKLFGWRLDEYSSYGCSVAPSRFDPLADRCRGILRYWIESELFDLPTCPSPVNKHFHPAGRFTEVWGKNTQRQIREGKLELTDKSRLVLMFQCHYAGYLMYNSEVHPNYNVPRTFLVSQAMVPQWDEVRHCIIWKLSDDVADQTVNLASIRTLYRKCQASVPDNMSLYEWMDARLKDIEGLITRELSSADGQGLDTETLYRCAKIVNRLLAKQFWPNSAAHRFMAEQSQPLDAGYDDSYIGHRFRDGEISFRWRFCFYPDGNENQQLGPFFVKDLERLLDKVMDNGTDSLSTPLRKYLFGHANQVEVGSALDNGEFFHAHTARVISGRWPENPDYGLSLLQSFAVNTALDTQSHPVVAVNGPPGTGKTTLLKDVIAACFVARTRALADLSIGDDWLGSDAVVEAIMAHSMVVASSNNKAVENISRELPQLSKIHTAYQDQIGHFKSAANIGDWGTFCAVLGNQSNRGNFKPVLERLKAHLRNLRDPFSLNDLIRRLESAEASRAKELITDYVARLNKKALLIDLASDLQKTPAYQKHAVFLGAFRNCLNKVALGFDEPELAGKLWMDADEAACTDMFEALNDFKRQWFGIGLGDKRVEEKLAKARACFELCYQELTNIELSAGRSGLNISDHLLFPDSYARNYGESDESAEQRLQKSSPLGSKDINGRRSELFIAALALNEALLESVAKALLIQWDELSQLIDGRSETFELQPEYQHVWATLFLFFPVVSTSLSSVQTQFKLMQKKEGFGLVMFDEAGQAVNYHVAGLLQRSRQAIFVGDPIQIEPVVTTPESIDRDIAADFMPVSVQGDEGKWGDDYLVKMLSAQSIADRASGFYSMIGHRRIGIPLLVHRRCVDPMFSIANQMAYDGKMVLATHSSKTSSVKSGWVNVVEQPEEVQSEGYINDAEADAALTLIRFLAEEHPDVIEDGIFVITPFTKMAKALENKWNKAAKLSKNEGWMCKVLSRSDKGADPKVFAENNIGTVHTFQGKEAGVVILCLAASTVRKKSGGISWVNSTPNLLNVAVTRAKKHLFILGNRSDWVKGEQSRYLLCEEMESYQSTGELVGDDNVDKNSFHVTDGELSLLDRFF